MKIDINIDELIEEFNLPDNLSDVIVESCIQSITNSIYWNWQDQARKNLKSTRNSYINGLVISSPSQFSRVITLKGKFNNMLESGADPFDMKKGFANSTKVKYTKDGKWLLHIPFRFGSSGIIGENSSFSGVLPKEIYSLLTKSQSNKPLKKKDIPAPFNIPQSRQAIIIPKSNIAIDKYVHKSSIYEGVSKQTSVYGKTTQNIYKSFRTVSENSDPNSWIHSGIKAYNLLDKAIKNTDIRTITENQIDKILKDFL